MVGAVVRRRWSLSKQWRVAAKPVTKICWCSIGSVGCEIKGCCNCHAAAAAGTRCRSCPVSWRLLRLLLPNCSIGSSNFSRSWLLLLLKLLREHSRWQSHTTVLEQVKAACHRGGLAWPWLCLPIINSAPALPQGYEWPPQNPKTPTPPFCNFDLNLNKDV